MQDRDNLPLRRADLVTSVLLIAFGAWVLWEATQMPWVKNFGMSTNWYLSPGLFPAILGVLLIGFASNVLIHAIKAGALVGLGAFAAGATAGLHRNRAVLRSAAALAIIGLYVFVGLGSLNYYFVTSVFCLALMVTFHRPHGKMFGLRTFGVLVAVSVMGPLFVGQVFSRFFYVPLP